jgi:hypothetical protein
MPSPPSVQWEAVAQAFEAVLRMTLMRLSRWGRGGWAGDKRWKTLYVAILFAIMRWLARRMARRIALLLARFALKAWLLSIVALRFSRSGGLLSGGILLLLS